jgi:sortase A
MLMKYRNHNYRNSSFRQRHRWLTWLIPAVLLTAGVYLLFLVYSPRLATTPLAPLIGGSSPQTVDARATTPDNADYIIIPKINLNVAIVTGTNEAALPKGAWHRFPERGDPIKGGNFILSAHRFLLGWTPQQTRAKSPFYSIDKLNVGDTITIIYKGKTYSYHITKTYSVKPNQVSIEDPSTTAKLTLYSCTLKGSADGRSVIEAQL